MTAFAPRALAATTVLALVLTAGLGPVAAAGTVQITGTILDPDGRPAVGFRIVLVDLDGGNEFTSAPSGADGGYSMAVPVGGRYSLSAVLGPDGAPLPVQTIPPIVLDESGTRRLDVAFQRQAPVTNLPRDDRDDRSGVPWYKKPWGITAMVLGGGAVAALALGGGGDGPVSPSSP
jgi:hypothetical protein